MNAEKRKRIIEKLKRLADPNRNPNAEEVAAASAKLEELLLRERMETEEMEFRILFDLQTKMPFPWQKMLYDFICKINGCKAIYTVTHNGLHLLKAAGRPARLKKSELQFSWALWRISEISKKLPPNTHWKQRESYEHGAAQELVLVMKSVCESEGNEEATRWLRNEIKTIKEGTTVVRPLDPFWNQGKKAIKRSLS